MASIERQLQDLLTQKHGVGLANGAIGEGDSGGVRDARKDPNVALRVYFLHGTETISDGIEPHQSAHDAAVIDQQIAISKKRDKTGD